jgi:hypothetical protein
MDVVRSTHFTRKTNGRGLEERDRRGRVRETGEATIDADVAEAIRRIDIPLFTVFDRPARDLDFQLFRLAPDDLTGHKRPDAR